MNHKEVMQIALEALEDWDRPVALPAITALRAALAQQEPEPCKRHNPCERLPDGYCARCHSEMYP